MTVHKVLPLVVVLLFTPRIEVGGKNSLSRKTLPK